MTHPGLIDTGLKIGIFQVLRAVRENLAAILGAAALCGVIIYQLLATMPPIYTATAILWFDDRENRLLASDSAWSSLQEKNRVSYINEVAPIVKEAEVMDSLPIYHRIIAQLDLADRPDVLASDGALVRRTVKERIFSLLPAPIVAALSSSDDPAGEAEAEDAVAPVVTGAGGGASDASGQLLELAQRLGSIIRVTPNELTSVISVQVTSPDARTAAAIANAVPAAYKAEYNDRVTLASQSVVELLGSRVEAVRTRLLRQEPTISPDDIMLQQLTRDADAELFRSLLSRLNEVQQLQNIRSRPVHVLSPATVPTQASGAGPLDYAIIGFIAVVLLGTGAVSLRELMNDRLRFPVQIEEEGLEIIAVTPRLTRRLQQRIRAAEESGHGAHGSAAALFFEAMRRLTNLTAPEKADQSVALLLVSTAIGDGVSTTAFGLARAVARSGKKAVIVETDLTSAARGEADGPGLADVLAGEATLDEALVRTQADGPPPFWVLPAASARVHPAELLASAQMEDLMSTLRECFHVIILDAAPVSRSADAEVLAPHCDGTVLVMRYGTCKKLIRSALNLMDRVTDNRVGVLVTWAPERFFSDVYGTAMRSRAHEEGWHGLRRALPLAAVSRHLPRIKAIMKRPVHIAAARPDGPRKHVR